MFYIIKGRGHQGKLKTQKDKKNKSISKNQLTVLKHKLIYLKTFSFWTTNILIIYLIMGRGGILSHLFKTFVSQCYYLIVAL